MQTHHAHYVFQEDETQARWSMWSKWSQCSTTCGVGTQARTRRCKSKARCVGDNVQIRKCSNLPKCDYKSDQTSSENEVFSSKEEQSTETNPYAPEATFEMQPETVHTAYATDVEEVYIKPEPNYSTVYYYVNVTENLDHSYRGPCEPGYTHDNATQACDDIDECLIANNLCHSTQACVNTAGAYRCACPKGFTALGVGQRCLDMNECEQDIHGCEFACVNTAGGYVCACPRHLRLHADRHRCVKPSSQYKQYSNEELDSEDYYLSTAIDFPAKYIKNRN
uniref:EGF-like domain-containing protein n=1 Tax=Pectinophora gossypiella TaxID=13191 RepID=A0A1E1WR81_PECGO